MISDAVRVEIHHLPSAKMIRENHINLNDVWVQKWSPVEVLTIIRWCAFRCGLDNYDQNVRLMKYL